jgi:GNAT superfamily N-acetyltransferase
MLRLAAPTDLSGIDALLRGAGLPSSGVTEHLDTFVVFESDGSIAGVGGLEIYGSRALLRSLAVAPALRGRGIAASICDHLEEIAAIGDGIPFFDKLDRDIALHLAAVKAYKSGMVELRYEVRRHRGEPAALSGTMIGSEG